MNPSMMGMIGSLGGALISGGLGYAGASATNAANVGMFNQQEQFEEQMSNTAYQRSVADMKAAGLNPMMMFGSGGPANVPSVTPPVMSNPLEAASSSAKQLSQNAMAMAQSSAVMDKMKADTKLTEANTATALSNATVAATAAKKADIEGGAIDWLRNKIPNLYDAVGNLWHSAKAGSSGGPSVGGSASPVKDWWNSFGGDVNPPSLNIGHLGGN